MSANPAVDHPRGVKQNAGTLGRRDRYRRRQPAHRHSGGIRAGLETILVLSGVSTINDIDSMPFRPAGFTLPSLDRRYLNCPLPDDAPLSGLRFEQRIVRSDKRSAIRKTLIQLNHDKTEDPSINPAIRNAFFSTNQQ